MSRLGQAALIVSGSVLLSRLLGLGRETLLAALLGVTAEGDVYRYAFLIPDLLNYLLAGGFLSITLIPLLAKRIEEGDEQAANRDFTAVFRRLAVVIIVLTGLLILAAEPLVRLAFPSLTSVGQAEVARLSRIVLPAQIAFVLGSLFMAYQYVHRRFLIPALAPLLYNLGIIVGGFATANRADGRVDGFIWGALLGAVTGTFALQLLGARRAGLRFSGGPSRAWRAYLTLALPLMVGQSVTVLDEQFPRLFGQLGESGSASALSLARMLNMLPVGIIAQAAAVASFPFLARLVAGGDEDEVDRVTNRALGGSVIASLLLAALVVGAALPLVKLVYEWGRFGADDSETVAGLLSWFALAIPAWAIHQILGRWFYAHRRMWLPVAVGTASTLVAVVLNVLLFNLTGVEGIAIASSAAMWIYTLTLALAWTRDHRERGRQLTNAFGRGLVPAVAASWAVRLVADRIPGASQSATLLGCLLALGVGVVVFAAIGRPLALPQLLARRPNGVAPDPVDQG